MISQDAFGDDFRSHAKCYGADATDATIILEIAVASVTTAATRCDVLRNTTERIARKWRSWLDIYAWLFCYHIVTIVGCWYGDVFQVAGSY